MTGQAAPMNGPDEFWQTEPGWVLVDVGNGGFLPFNRLTSMAILICDDGEGERVVTAMQLAGCPIIDEAEFRSSAAQHGGGTE